MTPDGARLTPCPVRLSMAYYLPRYLSYCVHGDEPIFLDRLNDRYFQLGASASSTFLSLTRGVTRDIDGGAERLVERGLLTTDATRGQSLAQPSIPPVEREALEEARPIWSDLAATPSVAVSLFRAMRLLRRSSFDAMLSRLAIPREEAAGKNAQADVEALSRRFDAARSFVPVAPLCLPDSLGLIDYLARRGHRVQLVLGVKTRPFVAHCWIQRDGVLLNDLLERVRLYTPILAI